MFTHGVHLSVTNTPVCEDSAPEQHAHLTPIEEEELWGSPPSPSPSVCEERERENEDERIGWGTWH